ncbi:MAG: alpha-glucosidase/alpha-galactosidase, partial [Chloroflexi bacterium]|nr:alpha-glucosidase/alpha-galactosidase [Chloroflexota bacterium]
MKIVLIGAGSHSFGRGQLADLLQNPDLSGMGVSLTLVDTDPAALDLMARLAQRIKQHSGTDVAIEHTTDRREALPGADYVITAVARRRMELWEQDFRVPLAYGFRHCLGENGGPGALFHALRSLELVLPICRDIEALCPAALLLNFSNPESRVLHAICHLTAVRAVGICHGVFGALRKIEQALRRPIDELHVVSAGINHFFNVLSIRDKATGEELRDVVLDRLLHDPSIGLPPLAHKLAELWGLITYPSDDHIGEYLSFGSEYHGVKWPYGRETHAVPAGDAASNDLPLDLYARGARPLDEAVLRTSGEITV